LILHVIPTLKTGGAERQLLALVANRKDHCIHTLENGGIFKLPFIIRRIKPDIIQSWLYYGDLFATIALYLSGRRHKTKLYWNIRCSDMDLSVYSWKLRLAVWLCARLSRLPDGIIANSWAGVRHHISLGYSNNFRVIANGVDTDKFFSPTQHGDWILHVGRNDPVKDHETFFKVAQLMPHLQFAMAGPGTENLISPSNVKKLNPINGMPIIYGISNILISTSLSEGFPNAIAEAMSCGVPVVATDVGDSRDIVGNTGIIVRPKDVNAMVAAITRLINDPEKNSRSKAARNQIINNYSMERARAQYDELYGLLHRSRSDLQKQHC